MSHDCCHDKGSELERLSLHKDIRRVLIIVLMLNGMMFAIEFGAGLIAQSAALMADSVDMLGDALVYAMSLYALGRSIRWRAGAALIKGGFIMLVGAGVLVEIVLKIVFGTPPSSDIMFLCGTMALVANLCCLGLLWPYRRHDVNLSSTFECSRNDVIANLGVIGAAFAVAWAHSPWPDVAVALAIAFLFFRSAIRVIADAWPQYRMTATPAE